MTFKEKENNFECWCKNFSFFCVIIMSMLSKDGIDFKNIKFVVVVLVCIGADGGG